MLPVCAGWDLSIPRYVEVALSLAALKGEGLVREIGLTNFALAQTKEFVDAGVPVAATQVQLSLLDRRAESSGLLAYCASNTIQVLPYGVLAGGLLSDRYLGAARPSSDPSQHETRSLTKYLLIVEEAGGWEALQALLRKLRSIADRVQHTAVDSHPEDAASQPPPTPAQRTVSIAEVAVAWALSRPAVGAVIIGARGQGKIDATRACAGLSLSPELLAKCTAAAEEVLTPVRGEVYELERERDGVHGRIMRYNLQAMQGEAYVVELEERACATIQTMDAFEASQKKKKSQLSTSLASRSVAVRRLTQQASAIEREAQSLLSRMHEEGRGEAPAGVGDLEARAAAVGERMRRAISEATADFQAKVRRLDST
jgi:aryl-alcohol dehydrogenase-like predicted oxidoreductase